jgi:hypothetical protein
VEGLLKDPYKDGVDTTSLYVSVHCPVNLFIIDPNNRCIGFDEDTKQIINEIYGAVFINDPKINQEVIWIPEVVEGTYQLFLTGTEEGTYNLTVSTYNLSSRLTTTYFGNISTEKTQTFTVDISAAVLKLYAWQFIFEDLKRHTLLRLNVKEKYFQFIAPDKEFPVLNASRMVVLHNEIILVWYNDFETRAFIAAIPSMDFCFAFVYNKELHKLYFLLDKAGWE